MDKRNRLGWVPMLLKAYNDAKQALEAKMQELEQNQPPLGDAEKLPLYAPPAKQSHTARSYPQDLPRGVTEPETRSTRSYLQTPPWSVSGSGSRNTHSNAQAPTRSRFSAKAAKKQTDAYNRPAPSNVVTTRYTRSRKRPKRQENSLNYPRVVPSSYQSVVRELQETRRRLNRIETVQSDRLLSIQEELRRMQEKLDRRILEIANVLGKHKSHRT